MSWKRSAPTFRTFACAKSVHKVPYNLHQTTQKKITEIRKMLDVHLETEARLLKQLSEMDGKLRTALEHTSSAKQVTMKVSGHSSPTRGNAAAHTCSQLT